LASEGIATFGLMTIVFGSAKSTSKFVGRSLLDFG
jgi:hypothetical protein